ncbi:MAG TPA: DUF4142 domain-containing protein [Acidisarcina sp.]
MDSKCTRMFSLVGAAALCLTTAAYAQMTPGQSQQQTSPASGAQDPNGRMSSTDKTMAGSDQTGSGMSGQSMDKMFVHKALQGGMAEVELGQLALTKSNDPDIKAFAQKMVDDHTKMGDDMKVIAQQIGVPVPKRLSKKDQETKMKLSSLDGAAFNKSYIKDMVKDHEMDDREFKQEAQNGTIDAVKSAAATNEPTISMHLDMARKLQSGSGSGNSQASNQ